MGIPNITTKIAHEVIGNVVDISRMAASEQRPILAILKKLEASLIEELKTSVPSDAKIAVIQKQAKLNALLKNTQKTIVTAYREIGALSAALLAEVAQIAIIANAAAINGAIGVDLWSVGVPKQVLSALAKDTLVQGAPAAEWWGRQSVRAFEQFGDVVRQGVLRGEGWEVLAKRVRGIAELRGEDGLTAKWKRDSVTLVRTSVQSVANAGQMAGYEANSDLINGVQALVTLDLKTSLICISRSGAAWDIATGDPLPQSTRKERFPGPPPWHFRCRTVLIPILKNWSDLATDPAIKERLRAAEAKIPRSTQASMDGQVSEDFTYSDWLKTKSKADQIEVLGQGRWNLWDKGKIGASDLLSPGGNPLTLKQLREKIKIA